MTKTEISTKVHAILRNQLCLDAEDEVNDSQDIRHGLHADSLDVVEICMAVEDEFNLSLSEAEVDVVQSVGDLVALIDKKLNTKG